MAVVRVDWQVRAGQHEERRENIRSTTNEHNSAMKALLPSTEEVLVKARAPI